MDLSGASKEDIEEEAEEEEEEELLYPPSTYTAQDVDPRYLLPVYFYIHIHTPGTNVTICCWTDINRAVSK